MAKRAHSYLVSYSASTPDGAVKFGHQEVTMAGRFAIGDAEAVCREIALRMNHSLTPMPDVVITSVFPLAPARS